MNEPHMPDYTKHPFLSLQRDTSMSLVEGGLDAVIRKSQTFHAVYTNKLHLNLIESTLKVRGCCEVFVMFIWSS